MKERVLAYGKSTQLTTEELGAVAGGKNIIRDIFKDIIVDNPSFNFTGNPGVSDGDVGVRVRW